MKINLLRTTFFLLSLATSFMASAQSTGGTSQVRRMKIGGTIRGKYEYQTSDQKGRFEVRTARVNVAGDLNQYVSYKASATKVR